MKKAKACKCPINPDDIMFREDGEDQFSLTEVIRELVERVAELENKVGYLNDGCTGRCLYDDGT